MPTTPPCDGVAYLGGDGLIHEQAGYAGRGSTVPAWDAYSQNYASGVFCVTGTGGNLHGDITASGGVTFYFTNANYSSNFNGGGSLVASAPTTGTYAGVLIYMAPQVNNNSLQQSGQSLELHGNGTGAISGTVIAPSGTVIMYGNSGTVGYDTQVIAWQVSAGGSATVKDTYGASDNYQTNVPVTLTLIK